MKTVVVNLRNESYDVYIGRAGHGEDGYFGNPIRLNKTCRNCGGIHETPGETIPCFREIFQRKLRIDLEYKERVLALRGKRLGCFCKPRACHGDVIKEYLDAYDGE